MSDTPVRERVFSTFRVNANTSDQEKQKEMQIIQEYSVLKSFQTSGVYVLPHFQSIRIWNGVVFVRSGLYADSTLKFRIDIPYDYPTVAPVVQFISPIFHPLIETGTGRLSLLPRFAEWKANSDFLFMLIGYIKEVFFNKDLWTEEFAFNMDAYRAFITDEDILRRESKNLTENIYETSSDYSIKFTQFNAVHKKILDLVKIKDPTATDEEIYESFMARFKKEFK